MIAAPKVAVGFPYYRYVNGDTMMSVFCMVARSASKVALMPIESNGCYIEENRNGIVQFALDTGLPFDYLLWIDSDMVFPDTALLTLLDHEKDIVGCNYRRREPPYAATGLYADGTDLHLLEPGLHRMRQLPGGLTLVKFDIYRKLDPPWYRAPRNKQEPRDEMYFCNYAREAGFEIWCDHDLTRLIKHDGVGWFAPDQIVEVKGGNLNHEQAEVDARLRAEQVAKAVVRQTHDGVPVFVKGNANDLNALMRLKNGLPEENAT